MTGQQKLFDDTPYFFYITNLSKKMTPQKVVAESNNRCDQENIIAQGKAMGALSAPLHDLVSNWAYIVMAMLAWNLKCWLSLSLRETGNAMAREKRRVQKQRVLRIPAQILNSGRRLIYRILTWTPSLEILLCLHENLNRPLRT
jgi:hypothetical protein